MSRPIPRALLAVVALAVMAAGVSGCGTSGGGTKTAGADAGPAPENPPPAQASRIVSLVPAATEILFSIGAGPSVVGVSSYDHFPPEVDGLPKVGALLDPDTEKILSLRPDLVVLYGSQTDQVTRFDSAGVRTYRYRHGGVSEALATIGDLGEWTGHQIGATRLARGLEQQLAGIRTKVEHRRRPRTLLVISRQPGTLRGLYVSGGVGFLHDMLEAAGGTNVYGDAERESVQPSHEALLLAAPDVVVEVSALPPDPAERAANRDAWSLLSTIPAVRDNRVLFLSGEHLVVPGPRMGEGTEALARALHPDAFR